MQAYAERKFRDNRYVALADFTEKGRGLQAKCDVEAGVCFVAFMSCFRQDASKKADISLAWVTKTLPTKTHVFLSTCGQFDALLIYELVNRDR